MPETSRSGSPVTLPGALPPRPTTFPLSLGAVASSVHAIRTGAHRSPYLPGWNGDRRSTAASVVVPAYTNASPVARLVAVIAEFNRCAAPGNGGTPLIT